MFRYFVLAALLAAGACAADQHRVAGCRGPLVVLNTDKWRPSAMEVDALDKLCPEDKQ